MGGGGDEVAAGGVDHDARAVVVGVAVGAGGEERADRGLGGGGPGLQGVGGLPSGGPPVRPGAAVGEGLAVHRRLRLLPDDHVQHGRRRPVRTLGILLVDARHRIPAGAVGGDAAQLPDDVPEADEEQDAQEAHEHGSPYGGAPPLAPVNLAEHVLLPPPDASRLSVR